MKNYKLCLTILCFGLSNIAYAASAEPLKEVSEIVEIPDLTQKQIFDSSKIWIAQKFNSSNDVIQYEDSNTGTIIGKGNMKYPCSNAWKCAAFSNQIILFTLKIDTKDNKARLTFSDLRSKSTQPKQKSFVKPGTELEIYTDKDNVANGIKKVIEEFGVDIKKSPSNSNW